MPRIVFQYFLVFAVFAASGQAVFCPPGAEWNYLYGSYQIPPYNVNKYNERIVYSHDSIIGIDTSKVLKHQSFFLQCSNHFSTSITLIKQRNDTILFKNPYTVNPFTNNWEILYIYNTTPGSSWKTRLTHDQAVIDHTITVNSVSTITVNGIALSREFVTFKRQQGGIGTVSTYSTSITERFGCDNFMFNFYNKLWGFCDYDYFQSFLCYRDNAIGIIKFTSMPCDIQHIVGETEYSNSSVVKLAPNPAKEDIVLSFPQIEKCRVSIMDTFGQIVLAENFIESREKRYSISHLPIGVYIVTVGFKNYTSQKRFIKVD